MLLYYSTVFFYQQIIAIIVLCLTVLRGGDILSIHRNHHFIPFYPDFNSSGFIRTEYFCAGFLQSFERLLMGMSISARLDTDVDTI